MILRWSYYKIIIDAIILSLSGEKQPYILPFKWFEEQECFSTPTDCTQRET